MFIKSSFKEYRKHPYKVNFKNDNVFYLSGSQRAKLQYHILSQRYELVEVDEQDKRDLQAFCEFHYTKAAQQWFYRMKWDNGHECMITFGAALEVTKAENEDGNTTKKIKDVYCYSAKFKSNYAEFCGVAMQWEKWIIPIIGKLDKSVEKSKNYSIKDKKVFDDRAFERVIKIIYYQDGKYLTLPDIEKKAIEKWIYSYLKKGKQDFPYKGQIQNSDLNFIIDFQNDIEIGKQHDNTKHNQNIGKETVEETYKRLVGGDVLTSKEILQQGFNYGNIRGFVKYGLIELIDKIGNLRVFKRVIR